MEKRGTKTTLPNQSATLRSFHEGHIDEIWERRKDEGLVIGSQKIYALKFADDVVIVAADEKAKKDKNGNKITRKWR